MPDQHYNTGNGLTYTPEAAEDLKHRLDVALERIRRLEEGYASEARIVQAQTLDVKALGKNRRRILTAQVERMARVALGETPPRTVGWARSYQDAAQRVLDEMRHYPTVEELS